MLKPFFKDDIEEMLAKVKGKLDKERKKAQVEDLVSHGYSTELEEAIHARLADSQLTLEGFGLSTWLQFLLSKCIDQEKIGTSFPRIPHPRANEEGSTPGFLTTDLKIYEIADQVGFEDMNYFSQRFKQVVG